MNTLKSFVIAPLAILLVASFAFGQNLNNTGSGTITGAQGAVSMGGLQTAGTVGVAISGTWSATLQFEATVDGTNYSSVPAIVQATTVAATSTTANGQWVVNVAGMKTFRVRASAYTSGTATITLVRTTSGSRPGEWLNSAGPTSLVACDKSVTIAVSAAATGKLITGAAGKQIYVCGFSISGDTAATVAQFQTGTGTTCGTGTANVSGAYKLAANGTLAFGNGAGTIFAPVAASTDFCLAATTGAVAGTLTYTQF